MSPRSSSAPSRRSTCCAAPPAPSIVVDKAEIEKDDHLKSVIKKYFRKQNFMVSVGQLSLIVIADIEDLSVKSTSGTTFIADIKYRYEMDGYSRYSRLEYATSKIEKTAESYKVISFDRKGWNAPNPTTPSVTRHTTRQSHWLVCLHMAVYRHRLG